jgi:hypothetical protein
MTECFMFSGTRKEARDKFNDWAKDKRLKNMVIHEAVVPNRDSVSEIGIVLCIYYDEGDKK